MSCCGSSNDYDHHPQPRAYQGPRPQPQPRAGQQQQRRPDRERRRAQASATRAANDYGWTGQRSQTRNRDSYIEPELGQALVGLPGSDYRELSAAAHSNQLQRRPVGGPAPPRPSYQAGQRRAPGPAPPARYRPSPQRPQQYHHQQQQQRQQVVQRQPARVQPMVSAPPRKRQQPPPPLASLGQRPVVHGVDPRALAQPQAAVFDYVPQKPVRRDSNGVSECGDEDEYANCRYHTVSPVLSPGHRMDHDLYGQVGMGYGRTGVAF